jgi:glycine hydroxymethyltransferase
LGGAAVAWFDELRDTDPEIFGAIKGELKRKREGLEMIPSENFTSLAVMQALGSLLTDKYSEGYAGKRYYGGNYYIDIVEKTAIERAKKAFGVPHANVQPYSGSPANLAVYAALLKPGDTVTGQSLDDGGHLTHGWKASFTGQTYNSIQYHSRPDGYIDIDEVRKIAQEHKPKLIWIGATAYARTLPFEEFAKIADECGAYLAADVSHVSGLILGGAHPSPVPYAHVVMTTTHKTLRGPRGAMLMVTDKGLQKDPELADKIDRAVFPGIQGGPHNHQTAAIAVALLEASKPEFKVYARQIVANCKALADSLSANGMKMVTGGTDNHLILLDLTNFGPGLGMFAEKALDEANITTNKNTIPHEPVSPFYPSGIRLGTAAVTTRGMKEPEMKEIGRLMAEAIKEVKDCKLPADKPARLTYIKEFKVQIKENKKLEELRKQVMELCSRFPLYPGLEL